LKKEETDLLEGIFKLKQCLFKLLVICHVLLLTFENSNQIKLVQIGSNWIKLIIWFKSDKIGSNWIKSDQVGSNWIKLDQIGSKKIKMNQIDYLDMTGLNEIR
jgi:hypothetical protein